MSPRPRHPMPDFVREALKEYGLGRACEVRSSYKRNDYLGWIARAKREEARRRHLAQMLDEFRRGDVYRKKPWGDERKEREVKRPETRARRIAKTCERLGD